MLKKNILKISVYTLTVITAFTMFSCAKKDPFSIFLMPAPDVYSKGYVDPFKDRDPNEYLTYKGILYATDRAPSDVKGKFYKEERSNVLRLGMGELEKGDMDIDWEAARQITMLKNRSEKYPLRIESVQEMGMLDIRENLFNDPDDLQFHNENPGEKFVALINEKLEASERKDIYIYVHGYKVVFTNPLLISAELWHFLGYDGVFIAYAWPSTPKTLAYASDLETTALSAHFLQMLIEFLTENTHAENIHIVGYSAGTRVVITTLFQLALLHHGESKAEIQKKLRIGNVILVGSDFDRQLFSSYVAKGLLNIPTRLSIYMSEGDKALFMSRKVFRRSRLGQMLKPGDLTETSEAFLRKRDDLVLINVTEAEGAHADNGHSYFRKSPWVSSDILMTLMYDLRPEGRGLKMLPDMPVWTFPEDYFDRLADGLRKVNPDLILQLEKKSKSHYNGLRGEEVKHEH